MKTITEYPSQEAIRAVFTYKNGHLINKPKTGNTKGEKIFNKKSAGKIAGSIKEDKTGYKSIIITSRTLEDKKRCYVASRLIWIFHKGAIPAGMVIDHDDQDPLNNKIENLVLTKQKLNVKKASVSSSKASGLPKGVTIQVDRKSVFVGYNARVTSDNKEYFLGTFSTVAEAKMVRDAKAKELHKDFFCS